MSSAPPVSTIVDDQTPPSPLVPPTQPFVEHSTSSAPPRSVQDVSVSARTSFTRVDIEEDGEQRSRAPNPLSGDPLTVPGPAPLSVAVLPIQHEVSEQPSTTSQDALQGEAVTTSLGEDLVPQTPQTYLTFLLISGRKRTMAFEPATAIGRVKELVWNSWPADWQDERPPAPSYLRVLYLGRMLQDDESLNNLKLPTFTPSNSSTSAAAPLAPTPTIMHLSIRPYAPPGEGDGIKKKKRRGQDANSPSSEPGSPIDDNAGCCGRCIIC